MYDFPIFISHSWSYEDHYECLCKWLFGEGWEVNGSRIQFRNTSVPRDNPIHYAPNEEALRIQIFERIALSLVVIIPTGMYASHSYWIGKEIDGARENFKPILAVNPWAQERKSSVVASAASLQVGWNKKSVIDAVWKLGPYG